MDACFTIAHSPFLLFLTKTSHILKLEHSQIYSLSHLPNGPTLIVAHTITHTRMCLCTLLDTQRDRWGPFCSLPHLGKTKDQEEKRNLWTLHLLSRFQQSVSDFTGRIDLFCPLCSESKILEAMHLNIWVWLRWQSRTKAHWHTHRLRHIHKRKSALTHSQ